VYTDAVRAAFDAQVRRKTRADEPGAAIEADAGVLRWLAPGTQTSCITWSGLTRDSRLPCEPSCEVRTYVACRCQGRSFLRAAAVTALGRKAPGGYGRRALPGFTVGA